MPRAKLQMKLTGHAGARAKSFKQRKKGLKKQAWELATLCGVDVAVVYAGSSGAPEVCEFTAREGSKGALERYRGLSPEEQARHTHLAYAEGELGKGNAKLARKRQGVPRALASWAEALDDMTPEELLASIDAALLATAGSRKALGLPADDDADGDLLRRILSDVPCIGDGFEDMDGWAQGLLWGAIQPPLALDAGVQMQPAAGVQYIYGDSMDMGGYQQLQMPGDGDNDLGQFAWDGACQPNAIAHPGCGYQFTDSNYVDMKRSQTQVPGYGNAHDGWLNLATWSADELSCSTIAPCSSVCMPAQHCAPGIGDNFTSAPGIGMVGNFMDANANQYKSQRLADDFQFQFPNAIQHFGLEQLHYLSDRADGVHF